MLNKVNKAPPAATGVDGKVTEHACLHEIIIIFFFFNTTCLTCCNRHISCDFQFGANEPTQDAILATTFCLQGAASQKKVA